MNKTELELRCEDLQRAVDKTYNDNLSLDRQISELESETDSLKQKIKRIIEAGNSKADFIKQILIILVGEAEINSKYQVIRDMFLEQIKEIEESRNYKPHCYSPNSYPSDKIYEDRL